MVIIGIGNLHGGDDAAGILVARELANRAIESIQHEGSPIELMDLWQATDYAIVIDAVSSGSTAGTIDVWNASVADLPTHIFRSSTHAFGLAETIRLARTLERLPRRLTIYGIEGAHFVAGAPPSPAVLKAVKHVVEEIASSLSEPTISW